VSSQAQQDPRRSSYYVGDEFYADLVRSFTDWQRPEREIADPAVRDSCRRLVEREARYLDNRRFDEWLALYAEECLYWAPATPNGGDPRREVAVAFDDRRRLEDRVFRLKTGTAWSQVPPSRTVHLVTNLEAFATDDSDMLMLRSNFLISEFRAGDSRTLSGWYAHRVARRGKDWEIRVKQVNLTECDQNIRNPSIIF
jgi:3-phenylpropionate/cinnamic acid dioxygenase small subunit